MGTPTVIRIQEQSTQEDGFHAIVSIDSGPQYPIIVHDPFEKKQEEELEWYFEEHLVFPFTQKVRAKDAAASLTTYGEALFKQVFQDNRNVYAEYKALLKTDLGKVQIEIAGSPKFHALHWEALKYPQLAKPLALQAMMLRRNMQPPPIQVSVQPAPTINLLIVTSRPYGVRDVSYRTISRPLVEALHLFLDIEKQFARYPAEKLVGSLGVECVNVMGTIANSQLDLKQYEQAEVSYHKVLERVDRLDRVDKEVKSGLKAFAYHQMGKTALEQQQWTLAEKYYQQALQIEVESNDRYRQASTYRGLAIVAHKQRQWKQAEQNYRRALDIAIEFNDRNEQAVIYHNLGIVAQEQGKWEEAEGYYQQALQIKVEYNARYEQASTYGQLGLLAKQQQQWQQARDYLLQALEIFASYKDNYSAGIAVRSVARLW